MKISDEQLQAWIELLETAEPKSDAAMQNIIPLAVARELQQLREERQNLIALVRPLKDAIADQRLTEVMQEQVEWLPDAVRALKVLEPAYISNFDEYALPMDLPEVE
jgi:hypothetical protein